MTGPSQEVIVRPFAEGDHDTVVALWRQAFPSDPPRNEPRRVLRRKLARDPEHLLVAELAGRVVGVVVTGFDGYRGWAYHLAVAEDARRRGVGRALMLACEERLRALGCPKLNLQVRRSNEGVVEFYRRLGYELEDRLSMGRLLP